MVSKLLLLTALSALTWAAPSPTKFGCKTENPPAEVLAAAQQMQKDEAAGMRFTQATIEVDTYFHVVSASNSVADGNVPDSQLTAQLNYMNQAYAPHSIHFNLKGTDRTINSKWADDGDETAMKKALRKGSYSAVNIYFLRTVADGAFGYCYFPTSGASSGSTTFIKDGCSILSTTVPGGSATNYNLGGTVVHEVGHWFGLFHTFQGSSCSGSGDSVSDTPQQLSSTSGCPSSRDSCPNAAGLDPIHNYMDYSYDTCYEEFTSGQRTRMYNMWNTYRNGK